MSSYKRKTRNQKLQSEKTRSEKTQSEKTQSEKPQSEKPQSEKTQPEKLQSEKPQPEKTQSEKQRTTPDKEYKDTSSHKEKQQVEYYGTILLRIPKSLYHEITMAAEYEGVNLNQYILYKLAKSDTLKQDEPSD